MIEFPATNEAMRALLPAAMQAEIKAAYDARKLELSPPKKEGKEGLEWRQMTHTSVGETA